MTDRDLRVRLAAFQWLRAQMDVYGELLPRSVLAEGFVFDGVRVPLLGPQGIFKPAILTDAPLSITTIPGQYPDAMDGGTLSYAYRGTDPAHPDNRGLRRAMEQRIPLAYSTGCSRASTSLHSRYSSSATIRPSFGSTWRWMTSVNWLDLPRRLMR